MRRFLALFVVLTAFLAASAAGQSFISANSYKVYIPMFPLGRDGDRVYSVRLHLLASSSRWATDLVNFRDMNGSSLGQEFFSITASGKTTVYLAEGRPLTIGYAEVRLPGGADSLVGYAVIEGRKEGQVELSISVPMVTPGTGFIVEPFAGKKETWLAIVNPGVTAAVITLRLNVTLSKPTVFGRTETSFIHDFQLGPGQGFAGYLAEVLPEVSRSDLTPNTLRLESSSPFLVNAYSVDAEGIVTPQFVFPR